MNTSEKTAEISKALSAFQGEVGNPEKSATAKIPTKSGGEYSYNYATLPEILKDVRPILAKHGLSVIQSPGGVNGIITLSTMIFHESGEWLSLDPISMPFEGGPQVAGSAITYLRRYAICAALGIAGEDDDDGTAAESEKPSGPSTNTPVERTEGGATRKQYNFAKKLFVDRGICQAGYKGEGESEKLARRDDNKVAVISWLRGDEIDPGDAEDPLAILDGQTLSSVIDMLIKEIAELAPPLDNT